MRLLPALPLTFALYFACTPLVHAQAISSVIFKGTPANPTILINGQGFNPRPAASSLASAGSSGSNFGTALYLSDTSGPALFHAGCDNGAEHDYIGLVVLTYADNLISYTFGSNYRNYYYPNHDYHLNEGDNFTVYVRNVEFSGIVHYQPDGDTHASPAEKSRIRTMVNPTDAQKYVWIPPGAFTMGCSPGDTECNDNEKPPHPERIANGFWLGQTEVTQAAYLRVTGANPSAHQGDPLPVESLTWNHAANYCTAIGGRLPTDAEWEYAARAGSELARYGSLDAVAWHSGNGAGATHPVATKQPNAFGLYDMLGNVWEWVADSYPGSEDKILRGGAVFVDIRTTRASTRARSPASLVAQGRGFRCAGEWPAPEQTAPAVSAATAPVPVAPAAPEAADSGDRVYRVGGGVTAPTIAYSVSATYTDAARKAKVTGEVGLYIQVDPSGRAINIRVTHSLGYGLDETAVETIKKWRFKPGMKDGRPVTVEANVGIVFQL